MESLSVERLVEDNVKLAYYIANKWLIRLSDYNLTQDELVSECMFGLFKAAKYFDSEKGFQFATFATKAMDNQVLMMLRTQKKLLRVIPISSLMVFKSNQEEFSIWDNLQTAISKDDISEWVDLESTKKACETIDKRSKEILYLKANGLTQRDIGAIKGYSQSYISRILKGAKRKVTWELNRR